MNAAVWIFLQSCAWGVACGVGYSFLRLICRLFPGKHFEFWMDGLFFFIVSLYVFRFSLRFLDGRLRFFVLMGWLLGGILCRFTFGEIILSAGRRLHDILCRSARSFRQFKRKKSGPLGHND